ncbi:MAG: hypothetical protein KKD99_05225 [Proteobacteria bacterium]|nr:hypothetical protein [Pseudomonadota bacterium]MBU4354419.1 hypothetical protein [Pseudomonadota bacterium]MBU4447970.1 hypothetical protein [Pseudomonadota bacterium]MCG2772580.1 hypothetical protein [Desulfobacterales bacterium]
MKDDFGYPPKLDHRSELLQVALHELRSNILDQIEKLLVRVFYSQDFHSFYRDYKGRLDYKTFEQKLLQGLEEVRTKEVQGDKSNLPYFFRILSNINESISLELGQVNSQEEREDISPQILSLLLSYDYLPPKEWNDIVIHLTYLFIWWELHSRSQNLLDDFIPLGDLLYLSSFSKLVGASYELLTSNTMKGERELKRTIKASKGKKEKTDKRKAFIIAIYEHGKTIEAGTKSNKAYTIIKNQFEDSRGKERLWGTIPKDQKKMPTPNLDSIKRWLIEAGIHNRDFKKEGRYWIKQT